MRPIEKLFSLLISASHRQCYKFLPNNVLQKQHKCNPITLCAAEIFPQIFPFFKVFPCLHSLCLAGTKTLFGHQPHAAARAVFSDMSLACTTKVLNKNSADIRVSRKHFGGWFTFKYTANMLIKHPTEVLLSQTNSGTRLWTKNLLTFVKQLVGWLKSTRYNCLNAHFSNISRRKILARCYWFKTIFFVWGESNAQCHKSLTGTCPCCRIRFDIDKTTIYLCLKNIKKERRKTNFSFQQGCLKKTL